MPVATGLTIGELAEIAGVVVAVVSLLGAPMAISLQRTRRRLRQLCVRVDGMEAVERMSRASLARGLVSIDNVLDWSAGILHRLERDTNDQIELPPTILELRTLRVAVERAWAEARLLSDDRSAQVSALQQLTHRLGDAETATLLRDAACLGSLSALDCPTLRSAARQLSQRLADGSVDPS